MSEKLRGLRERLIVSTCDTLPGRRVRAHCGLARGTSTRATALPQDVLAKMKNLIGGEIEEYTKLFAECREECIDRMIDHALVLGADAILGMRFCSTEISSGVAELMAYGTAVSTEAIAE